ncbi:protein of unknown function DUF433 [Isosphaera pallida ATCC 43644]|uniref:DUF433 domain-containing protein n=1 Tax=Isosphaera pallida (strain ATCC 43644 / DSM 9630 / IS1B) TaxID=575540 RepID=E8QWT7_ISOPI|nr:DUF433 domain-containing protein [Isosphaera pallida]ADV62987.1 protein of unknown function DUF433 [Isosphaera pallida ATCC 43644]
MTTRKDRILERISINPKVCCGKPVIKGTRIWVSLILDLLAVGDTIEDILSEYPHITREDVLACIAYGAEAADDRFIEVPMSGVP